MATNLHTKTDNTLKTRLPGGSYLALGRLGQGDDAVGLKIQAVRNYSDASTPWYDDAAYVKAVAVYN